MELYLTDDEANRLIKMLKESAKRYNVTIDETDSNGELTLIGAGNQTNYQFKLIYRCRPDSKVFQFLECKYGLTLFRINLNSSFHKNADGNKVYGNRINIYSTEEFYSKNDNKTYVRAYPLPYHEITNTTDFLTVFENICKFASIIKNNKLEIAMQESML